MYKNNKWNFLIFIFMVIMLLLPSMANAQNIFEPVPGDKSMVLLQALFGKLGVFGASSADAFSGVIEVLNGAALTIGGILVAYTIFAGTLGTAHDGEMLGKKYSSVWVPIRTAMGTALVLPVVNGSYCVMQVIVGWLIVQGVGLADNVWSKYISVSNVTVASSVGLTRPEATNLGYTAFQSMVCIEALNKVVKADTNNTIYSGSDFGTTTESTTFGKKYYFGDMKEVGGFKKDTCGSVTVSNLQAPTMGPATGGFIAPLFNAYDSFQRMKSIQQEHESQLTTLLSSLQAQAKNLVDMKAPISTQNINQAISVYESGVQQKTASVIQQMDAFKEISENAGKDGFIMAGAYYMKLSSFTDMIHRSLSNVPTAVGPVANINPVYNDSYVQYLEPLVQTLEKTQTETATYAIGNSAGGSNDSWLSSVKSFLSSGLDFNILIKKLFTTGANWAINDGEHPIMAMKRLGDNLLNLAGVGLLAKGLAAMGTLGNLPGVGLMLQTTIILFAPPVIIAGVLLSYVLPMMPFMIWMGVILGWIVLCVEAILAAPIWAVMHLHPNGDDMVGKGANGYQLVLSLLIRPMLMVFGLIASLTILNVFGQFYNRIYADVFASSQQDSNMFIWLIGILMSAIVYCFGLWIIIKRTFSIISDIPDHMLEWLGQSSHTLGKSAQEVGSVGSQVAGAQVIGNMSNAGMNALGKVIDDKSKFLQDEKKASVNIDKDFGNGTSQMLQKIGGADGKDKPALSSLDSSKQQGMMKEAMGMLGGKDSVAGASFMERMKQSVDTNPELPFSEHLNGALEKGLNDLYGDNTLQTAMKVGFGPEADFSQDTEGKLLNPEFKRAISMYGAVSKSLEKGGMGKDAIKQTISRFNENVENGFKSNTDPSKEYKHIFSDELKKFRRD